jgi:hypothetical protein
VASLRLFFRRAASFVLIWPMLMNRVRDVGERHALDIVADHPAIYQEPGAH